MKGNPEKGKGDRQLDCPIYNECLDFAAKEDWPSFRCPQSCPYYALDLEGTIVTSTEKAGNARICEECGENPTISPKHAFCGSCLSRKSWSDESRNKRHVKRKSKATAKKIKSKKPSPHIADTIITVNFERYPSILKGIQEMAEDQVRPVPLQILYLLKQSLKPG